MTDEGRLYLGRCWARPAPPREGLPTRPALSTNVVSGGGYEVGQVHPQVRTKMTRDERGVSGGWTHVHQTPCTLHHAPYTTQHKAYSIHHAAYTKQHAACSIRHTAHSLRHTHLATRQGAGQGVCLGPQPQLPQEVVCRERAAAIHLPRGLPGSTGWWGSMGAWGARGGVARSRKWAIL